MDVEDERPRRVREIGRVNASGGQLPDEPGIDGPADELAGLGASLRTLNLVEDPADLRAGEIRVDHETGAVAEEPFESLRAKTLADRGARAALPNDRRMDRAAAAALPDDRRFALVGDADRREVLGADPGGPERFASDRHRGGEDLFGVVFNVPRRRIELPDLAIGGTANGPVDVEHDRARAGRPLIEREDRLHSVLKRRIGSTPRRQASTSFRRPPRSQPRT